MTPSPESDAESIIVEYELPGPPEKVWRALTEPALIARWLMDTDLQPVVGRAFTFRTQPMPGWDGVVQCEVLEVEPGRRLSYSWRGGAGEHRIDTVVVWTLRETASGGTLLRLEHRGFKPENASARQGLGKGWRGKVQERIAQILAELG